MNDSTTSGKTDKIETTGKTKEEIAEAYRSEPWWYDVRGFFILIFAYNSSLGAMMRQFGPNYGANHLEVACGTGTLLEMVLKWRKRRRLPPTHVTGIDYAESMLAGAIHRFRGRTDVTFRHADAAALPFPDNHFDTANIANSLHCLPNVDAALKDICRVMKPGGTFAANVLLYPRGGWPLKNIAQWIDDWGVRKGILFTPYEEADIRRRIVAAGFDVAREEVSGNCYNVMMRKPA